MIKIKLHSEIHPDQKPVMKLMGRLSEVTLIPSVLVGTCAVGTFNPDTGLCE